MAIQILKKSKLKEYNNYTNPRLEIAGTTWTFELLQPIMNDEGVQVTEAHVTFSGKYQPDYGVLLLDLDVRPSITTYPLMELKVEDLASLKRDGAAFMQALLENNR